MKICHALQELQRLQAENDSEPDPEAALQPAAAAARSQAVTPSNGLVPESALQKPVNAPRPHPRPDSRTI